MSYSDIFKALDDLDDNKKSLSNCCENIDNYSYINEIITCKCCNEVISNISDNPEWRYYGSDDSKLTNPTRCGMPINTLLPKSSVGSIISNQYSKDKSMYQVKKYTGWNSMTYKERSTYKVFNNLSEIAKKNNLSNKIVTEAKSLYKLVSDTEILRGDNRVGIKAASLYYACKNCGVSRSSKEIGKMFNISTSIMSNGIKLFQKIIHMSNSKNRIKEAKSVTPNDFIDRFCNKLKIDNNDIKYIKQICDIIMNINLIEEVRPDSIAAGCILFYSNTKNLNIFKKDISNISHISEVTINKCYKKIDNNLEITLE